MQVHRSLTTVPAEPPATVLVIGNFDGVHRGHQALFQLAVERAEALGAQPWAMTFDPHPSRVLAASPALAPPLICSLERRLELMEAHGLVAAVVVPFDRSLSLLSPEAFVDDYLVRCGARELVVGYDFSFGKDRSGTPQTLTRLGAERDIVAHVVPPFTLPSGLVPSSSKVREYVLLGRMDAAEWLLGRMFEVEGEVVPGAGRGAGIGFATANVRQEGELLPAQGVYAVVAQLEGEPTPWPGAANVGVAPTFGELERPQVEVHLIGWSGGSLRGRRMRVAFMERLRGERRFDSVDSLKEQIRTDVEAARTLLAERGVSGRTGAA